MAYEERPPRTSDKYYLSIIGGQFKRKVDEGTPGAVLRQYETSTGEKGEKWELSIGSIVGKVKGIEFKEGDFGVTCNVDLGKSILSMNTTSRFFTDFATKIAGKDLSKEYIFEPYDYTNKQGKKVQGLSIKLVGTDKELENYFYNWETKESSHGYPVPESSDMDTDDWKMFFIKVKKFLVNYLTDMVIPTDNTDSSYPGIQPTWKEMEDFIKDVEEMPREEVKKSKTKAKKEEEDLEIESLPF